MRTTIKNTAITLTLIIVLVFGIMVTVMSKAEVGNVTGKPYSIKQTTYSPFGAGTWVYYNEKGAERPLTCTKVFTINCKNDNNTVIFTATVDNKNQILMFPSIKINGEEHKIICAKDFFTTSCRTTLN